MSNRTSTHDEVEDLNDQLLQLSAEGIVAWAVQEFGGRLTFASSFGAEDVVL